MNEIIMNETEKVKTVVSKTKGESIIIMQTIKVFEGHEGDSTMEVVLLKDEAIKLANSILDSYK